MTNDALCLDLVSQSFIQLQAIVQNCSTELSIAMATNPADVRPSDTVVNLTGIARLIARRGLVTEEKLAEAIDKARQTDVPLITYLSKNRLASSYAVAQLASREFGMPLLDLSAMSLDQSPKGLVAEKLVRMHRALPLYKHGPRLFIAVSDPTNMRALEDIKFQTGLTPEPVIVVDDQLTVALDKSLDQASSAMQSILDEGLDDLEITSGDEADQPDPATIDAADDAPLVRFINKLLLDAINRGASDIHFEPYENEYRVRFRQDGILHEITKPPTSMAPRLAARLKIMARLNIAERRVPQDGRAKMQVSKRRAIDFRVNTLPTLYGEKVVMRILDAGAAKIGVDALGFDEREKKLFLNAIKKPQGMVLVTGPTGSGKTVTLYTALNILNVPEVNISTVEDPVEIQLVGANQVNVNFKTGLTFAEALRAFLRQDPDIIMLGEIRDLETAEIAIKAAQTGHMVLSTVHTNSAAQTLTRMVNMGVPAYNIASSVTLIIAQRLARKLCEHCKTLEDEIPEAELISQGFRKEELTELDIYRAVGCPQCTNGYRGRVGLFEVMPVSEDIGRIIMAGGNAMDIGDQAKREGLVTLRESGLNKIRAGVTSLEEINRVTKD